MATGEAISPASTTPATLGWGKTLAWAVPMMLLTALLMAGVLTAGRYYHGTEAETLAERIYERVDWPWMLNGGKTLAMGWFPLRRAVISGQAETRASIFRASALIWSFVWAMTRSASAASSSARIPIFSS